MNKKTPQRPAQKDDVLLTQEQAAKYLRVKPRTLQAWRYRGHGPVFLKLGKRTVRYRLSDLSAYIRASLRRSTSDPGPGE